MFVSHQILGRIQPTKIITPHPFQLPLLQKRDRGRERAADRPHPAKFFPGALDDILATPLIELRVAPHADPGQR